MKFWIIIHDHKHGVEAWPVYRDSAPSLEAVADDIEGFDQERESLTLSGPFERGL